MTIPFRKIGLAVTFSPNALALLSEVKRLQELFNSEVLLIHVGERTKEAEDTLDHLVSRSGLNRSAVKVIWTTGDPADSIIQKGIQENIDLLIAGALEQENIIKYYLGSVARKILRKAPFSVLIMTHPSTDPKSMNKFCVSVDYTAESENTVRKAYEFARLENAKEIILIREFQVPGLAMTVQDSGSTSDTEFKLQQWQKEEEDKLGMFIKEMDLKDMKFKTICLYGKQGWEANKYIHDIQGDILVVPGPRKKLKIFDRIFQHDIEFIIKQLPDKFLVVKS